MSRPAVPAKRSGAHAHAAGSISCPRRNATPTVLAAQCRMSQAERNSEREESMKKAKRKKPGTSSKKTRRSVKGVVRRTGAKLKRVAKKAAIATGMA
jgi:hypothetical protein